MMHAGSGKVVRLAVGYVRVSTSEQANERPFHRNQERKIAQGPSPRAHPRRCRLRSGSIRKNLGAKESRDYPADLNIGTVIVCRLDRPPAGPDITYRDVSPPEIELVSIQERIDTTTAREIFPDPMGAMVKWNATRSLNGLPTPSFISRPAAKSSDPPRFRRSSTRGR
jgi:hypothetical protein